MNPASPCSASAKSCLYLPRPLAVAHIASPMFRSTLSCENFTIGAKGARDGSCATIASRYFVVISSRHTRSHGVVGAGLACAEAVLQKIIVAHTSSTIAPPADRLVSPNVLRIVSLRNRALMTWDRLKLPPGSPSRRRSVSYGTLDQLDPHDLAILDLEQHGHEETARHAIGWRNIDRSGVRHMDCQFVTRVVEHHNRVHEPAFL